MSDMQKTDIRYCNTVIQMLEAELAAALAQRDGAREWVRATLGSAHLTEMDKFIKEGK